MRRTLTLTDVFLKAIKPPQQGRDEYTDTKVPALMLRVSPDGAAVWSLRYRALGSAKKARVQLGDYPRISLTKARSEAEAIRIRARSGHDPAAERQAAREDRRKQERGEVLTVAGLIDLYIADLKTRKDSWKQDEGFLLRDVKPFWGSRRPSAITKEECAARLLTVKARAPVSANRLRSALKTLFGWAVEQGLMTASPMDGIAKPTREKKTVDDIRALNDAELVLLWREIEKARLAPGIIAAFQVLMLTGQRPNEIAGLSLAELRHLDDPANVVAEIPAERMKGRRRHVWPISGPVSRIIRRQIAHQEEKARIEGRAVGDYVFASRFSERSTIARHSLSQALRRIIDGLDATGPDLAVVRGLQANRPTPHSFRRTVATGMARLRIPREDRRAVLAHAEDDVLAGHYDTYDRLSEKRVALDTWARHVEELLTGVKATGVVVPLARGAAR